MSENTPTPWRLQGKIQVAGHALLDNNGWMIAECIGPDKEANAALIVDAVNNHDVLVRIVENLKAFIEQHGLGEFTMYDLDLKKVKISEMVTDILSKVNE